MKLSDIYITFYSTTANIYSQVHMEHFLGRQFVKTTKQVLANSRKTEIIPSIFSDYKCMKLEKMKTGKFTNT